MRDLTTGVLVAGIAIPHPRYLVQLDLFVSAWCLVFVDLERQSTPEVVRLLRFEFPKRLALLQIAHAFSVINVSGVKCLVAC